MGVQAVGLSWEGADGFAPLRSQRVLHPFTSTGTRFRSRERRPMRSMRDTRASLMVLCAGGLHASGTGS